MWLQFVFFKCLTHRFMVGANKTRGANQSQDNSWIVNRLLTYPPQIILGETANQSLCDYPPRSLYHAQTIPVRVFIGRITEKVDRKFLNLSFRKPIIGRPNPHFQTSKKITFQYISTVSLLINKVLQNHARQDSGFQPRTCRRYCSSPQGLCPSGVAGCAGSCHPDDVGKFFPHTLLGSSPRAT